MNSPETHFPALPTENPVCKYCRGQFKPKRSWSVFCSTKCRNDYHGRSRRIEAIKARALPMYEALTTARELIRGKDVEHVWLNHPTEPALTLGDMIDAALKDLKAP